MKKTKTLAFEGYYGYGLESFNGVSHHQQAYAMVPKIDGADSSSISGSKSPPRIKKTQEASFKHALAERRRRRKINDHYDTLRKLFPHLPKRDKPSVLTETVRHMKELTKKMAAQHGAGDGSSCSLFIPGEKDEVMICGGFDDDDDDDKEDEKKVKALICCEDRPGLHKHISEAVRLVKGEVIKAKLATIGGRTKAELVVKFCKNGGGEEDVGALRRAFKAVVQNTVFLIGPDSKWAPLGLNWHFENLAG